MYLVYSLTLTVLLVVLLLLFKEEKMLRTNVTHGLANKYWVLRERRRFVRFDQNMRIRYNLLNSSNNHFVRAANLSQKGLCLSTYEKLKEKNFLDLEIEVPGFSKPVKLIGEVVWTKPLKSSDSQGRRIFYVGIKFSKIDPESEAKILAHLGKLKLP